MSLRSLFALSTLMICTSCAELHTGRTYLSEMEQDDSSFFSPSKDFPVVAGDTGKDWLSESERMKRTPASEGDIMEDRTSRALKMELRQLEGMQSEENLEFYNTHKHTFSSISQKIYFLKLTPAERREYLEARGIVTNKRKTSITPYEKLSTRRSNDVLLGMHKNEVLASLGKPLRVEVAGNPRNENERWLYRFNSGSKYIYFESGRVEGWE